MTQATTRGQTRTRAKTHEPFQAADGALWKGDPTLCRRLLLGVGERRAEQRPGLDLASMVIIESGSFERT